ncbi:MAG TPA: PKD domain-containing protein [Methanolinea sp.]|jgi:PKD repeat protein|nr:PKD domain-containing protein [Methanolinea sp.]HPC55025.1 PKD domain-containing protein [Methanolinea sp.]HRU80428.1 PKD domain-containing protein [Methanolinea sp.]
MKKMRSGSRILPLFTIMLIMALFAVPALAGNTLTATGEIVSVPPPVAAFTGSPLSGTAPLMVAFDASSSTGTITSYAWDFNNDGTTDYTSATPTASWTYSATGTYTVKVTVTGPYGTDEKVKANYITVTAPVKPVAAFTATPTSGYAPLSVQFTDLSTNNPTAWKWEYRKNPGTWVQFSTGQNPSFTFNETGFYSIRLTVTNAAGSNTVTRMNYIIVTRLPKPVANFVASPTSGGSPLTVQFTDTSMNNPVTWKWEYSKGSGTWVQFSTAQNPSFTFNETGSYSIRLTVTNAAGSNTVTRANYITVNPVRKPIALFSQDKVLGRAPLTVSFRDRSLYNPTDYFWTFGDGATSTEQNPVHTYTRSGLFTVQLRVSNTAGSDTARGMVFVVSTQWW